VSGDFRPLLFFHKNIRHGLFAYKFEFAKKQTQNGFAMQKHGKSMRCHRLQNRRTIRAGLAAFKGNIYQNISVREFPSPPYKII
jgi:hypothetical protein